MAELAEIQTKTEGEAMKKEHNLIKQKTHNPLKIMNCICGEAVNISQTESGCVYIERKAYLKIGEMMKWIEPKEG